MVKPNPESRIVCELLIPGLLGPLALPPDQHIDTPVLDRLLARGERAQSPGTDLESTLLGRFGAGSDIAASAPYCLAADAGDWNRTGYCMHADPVHLRTDRDLLRLFDARHLGIEIAEAQTLIAELNHHFASDGLQFSAPTASRWYLHCERPPALQTRPLAHAIGKHVDGLLPTGPDAAHWASLMNEAQMLLFQSTVNQQRETEGRPSINGIWTWGGGVWLQPSTDLSALPFDRQLPRQVFAEHPLASGLAEAAGISYASLPSRRTLPPQAMFANALIVIEDLLNAVLDQDEAAWITAAEALDSWFAQALNALRTGHLDRIIIDSCHGVCWRVDRSHPRRFWRKTRSLTHHLLSAPG